MLISIGSYDIRIERRPRPYRAGQRRVERLIARQRRDEALAERELAWRLRFPEASIRWPR